MPCDLVLVYRCVSSHLPCEGPTQFLHNPHHLQLLFHRQITPQPPAAEPEEEEGENQEEQENGDESDDTGVYDDEEGEIDFAGAALLEEGRTTAERLREPRTIVSRANKLVAEKKFSAALSHCT